MPETDIQTLRDWDRAHLWHPFTPQLDWLASNPLVISRAEGCYLFDTEGRRYLDGVSSLWCNVHGHRHPRIDEAVRHQLDRMAHVTLLGLTHPPAIALAHRLASIAPPGLTRVFFSDDGATAVEIALKMAFQYWRQKSQPEPARSRFIALENAYHGDTLGDVSLGGVSRFHSMFQPLLFPVLRAPSPHCYRCPLGLEPASCGLSCVEKVEELLKAHPGEVAAVVVEPLVQGAAGMIVHPEGYLRRLRQITRQHNTLLIADEVAVGFGRTGSMFACEQEDVSPDFLCLAKGLTGGYLPLAATLTTEEVYSAFLGDGKTFMHGHTYGGNPLGASAALACLDIFDEENTLEALKPKTARFQTLLGRLPGRFIGDIRTRGLIAGIELVADKPSKTPFPPSEAVGASVCRRVRDFGVLLRPLGDVVVLMPPLSISLDQLDDLFSALSTALRELEDARP